MSPGGRRRPDVEVSLAAATDWPARRHFTNALPTVPTSTRATTTIAGSDGRNTRARVAGGAAGVTGARSMDGAGAAACGGAAPRPACTSAATRAVSAEGFVP